MAASASQAKEDAPKDCEDEIEKEEEEEEEEYDAYGEEEAWVSVEFAGCPHTMLRCPSLAWRALREVE